MNPLWADLRFLGPVQDLVNRMSALDLPSEVLAGSLYLSDTQFLISNIGTWVRFEPDNRMKLILLAPPFYR